MNSLQAILEIILFLLAISICFYLPGKFLLTKLKLHLDSLGNLFLAFSLGIVIFTLVSYLFSWMKLEIIDLPIFLIICLLTIKGGKWIPVSIDKIHRFPLFIVIVLSVVFSLSMLTTGVYGDSIGYRGDDLWHLALINELKVNFPPDNPGFAGVSLKGYHFFYDFLLAKITNIFPISPFSLYFHFFPLFMAILWGLGVYSLMYVWSKKTSVAVWAVFLTQFGGSFAFILRLRGHTNLSLDSAFGIQQPTSALINPPFAISIIIVVAVLFALYKYFSTKEKSWLVPIVLCIGLVAMFKVYAGIILLGSFLLLTLFQLYKKQYVFLIAFFSIGILFILTYWVLADHSSKLIFAPLWAPHSVLIDNMPWYGYAEKMYTYTKLSVIKGIVETELYSWYVFLFGNLGTRLIGLLFLPFLLLKNRKLSFFVFTILIMTLISIFIPLFFIQSGKVFEIIQMAWYFLFFTSLFAAFGFYKLFTLRYNKILKILLLGIVLVVTLPSAYENYENYFAHFSSRSYLSSPYFKAMQFLKSQGNYNETILEIPDRTVTPTTTEVKRWYYRSSPAIVAFSNKRSFLNYEYFDFAGVNITPRIEFIRKIILLNSMTKNDSSEYTSLKEKIKQGLKENKISYIYSPYSLTMFSGANYISIVYQNKGVFIYKVYVE